MDVDLPRVPELLAGFGCSLRVGGVLEERLSPLPDPEPMRGVVLGI